MPVISEKFGVKTKGYSDIIDITASVEEIISKHKNKNAQALVYVSGSTASITTMEYEPGLLKDLNDAFETIAPTEKIYHHDTSWEEGNGLAHVRASILGTAISLPIVNNLLVLGTWQQIVLIDFDNKPRTRSVVVQIIY